MLIQCIYERRPVLSIIFHKDSKKTHLQNLIASATLPIDVFDCKKI